MLLLSKVKHNIFLIILVLL